MSWKYILPACFVPTLVLASVLAGPVDAEEVVEVAAPPAILETGLMNHLLPRFSLKTGVRLSLVDADADVVLGTDGVAFMQGLGQVWRVRHDDSPEAARFVDWLTSDVGQRTITSYAPEGTPPFGPPPEERQDTAEARFDGDAALGLTVARAHCRRCHAVVPGEKINDIGSTPSFFVLRALSDWPERFSAFFALNPHPAFTQIAEVTEPFPVNRPPPIAPIEMTLEEIEAVLAYVAGLKAADLGAALVHQ